MLNVAPRALPEDQIPQFVPKSAEDGASIFLLIEGGVRTFEVPATPQNLCPLAATQM